MFKVAPCLWFDDRAEEAADFYVSTFRACGQDASLGEVTRYGPAAPRPEGGAMTVEFTLAGQHLTTLNGGPHFTFSPAVSLVVKCADQAEVDRFWAGPPKGSEPGRAVGSGTGSACLGRSCRPCCARCCATPIRPG